VLKKRQAAGNIMGNRSHIKMKQLIDYQKNNKSALNDMCELLENETISPEEINTIKKNSTMLSKNPRHYVFRNENTLVKLKRHQHNSPTEMTIQKYEPNFGTLASLLALFKQKSNFRLAEEYTTQLLTKLIHLIYNIHQFGWFHNDIKPENILVCPLSENHWQPFVAGQEELFQQQKTQSIIFLNRAQFELFDTNLMNYSDNFASNDKNNINYQQLFLMNILYNNNYTLKLCDFEFMTQEIKRREIHGTKAYMSANQLFFQEQKSNHINSNNPSCDLYSLGMIMLQTLTDDIWTQYMSVINGNHQFLQHATSINQLREQAKQVQLRKGLQNFLNLAISLTDSCYEHRLNTFIQFNQKKPSFQILSLFCCLRNKKKTTLYEEPLLPSPAR
jgi:serine/threonine protein kinase